MDIITEKIQELRTDNDLKQKDIAKILKITQPQYHLYESGKRKMPIDQLKTLCEYYKVSADYILGLPKGLSWPR